MAGTSNKTNGKKNGTSVSAKNKPRLTPAEQAKYNRQVMQGRVERGQSYKIIKNGGSRKKRRTRK